MSKNYKQYVEKRVQEIRKNTGVDCWRFVPGKENIADLPSRGCLPEMILVEKERWLQGPCWMKNNMEDWPVTKFVSVVGVDDEVKSGDQQVVTCIAKADLSFPEVIDFKTYSFLKQLLRITAWCLRFFNACRK